MRNIIEENKGLIKAIIKKITGSYNEDIEQEVYIKTWKNIDNYKESGKLKSWIATITANLCRDYFKSSSYKQNLREVREDGVLESKAVVEAFVCKGNKVTHRLRCSFGIQLSNDFAAGCHFNGNNRICHYRTFLSFITRSI